MIAALRLRIATWLFQLDGPHPGVIVLGQRRIFILPTRQGITFGVVLALMLIGSINYNLSLGYVLTFLLGGMGLLGMLYTFRNLAQLRISAGRAQPVFAGGTARFEVVFDNPAPTDRYNLGLTRDKKHAVFVDIPAERTIHATIPVPATRRGRLRPGRITLFTRFPLGLYYAWSYLQLDMSCLVYPAPAPHGIALPPLLPMAGEGRDSNAGGDDFAGLRPYHAGDSPRHIAWKAAARQQGLLTKQFSGRSQARLWLDWSSLPVRIDAEQRLSILTRWVLDAHALGHTYGLRLPGNTIELNSGSLHRDRCLEALALHGEVTP